MPTIKRDFFAKTVTQIHTFCGRKPRRRTHAGIGGHKNTDLCDGDAFFHSCFEIDMVGTDARSHAHLEVGCHVHPLASDVRGPKRLANDNVCVHQLFFKITSRAVFVVHHDVLVAKT